MVRLFEYRPFILFIKNDTFIDFLIFFIFLAFEFIEFLWHIISSCFDLLVLELLRTEISSPEISVHFLLPALTLVYYLPFSSMNTARVLVLRDALH